MGRSYPNKQMPNTARLTFLNEDWIRQMLPNVFWESRENTRQKPRFYQKLSKKLNNWNDMKSFNSNCFIVTIQMFAKKCNDWILYVKLFIQRISPMQVNKYSHNFLEYCLNTSKGMPSIHVSQPSAAESCPSLVRERRRDVPAK